MIRKPICLLLLGLIAIACATGNNGGARSMSQVELRALQTRTFETTDTRLILKAMINALQDMGYIIKTADADLGVLTGEMWTNIPHTKKEVKKARKKEQSLPSNIAYESTANVTQQGNQCRVRVIFQRKVLGDSGRVMEAGVIQDAASYQAFFARVDKSVFLQKEGV